MSPLCPSCRGTSGPETVNVQGSHAISKLSPVQPHSLLWIPVAARSARSCAAEPERMHERMAQVRVGEREREQERESFFVPLGFNQEFFSKWPIHFPSFVGFWWAHLPTNLFFPQARLTGLYGQAPPPVPLPHTPQQSGTNKGGGEAGVLTPLAEMLWSSGVWSCDFLVRQIYSLFPVY